MGPDRGRDTIARLICWVGSDDVVYTWVAMAREGMRSDGGDHDDKAVVMVWWRQYETLNTQMPRGYKYHYIRV